MGGSLEGRVALVTGASKNIGKGIALELGAAGAAVYLTARTLEDTPGALGSLRQTAAEIEAAGGEAIPLGCDHGDDASVERVFDEISSRHGRLDLVVNVASPDFSSMVGKAFWELPFDDITRCLEIGPRSNYVTTALAARMMVPRRSGLIVNVSSHGSGDYLLSVPYGAGKAAIDKITRDTALELKEHGVAVVSLWPGLVLTEGLLSLVTTLPDGRRELDGLDISFGESPKFNGKAVVALATDPEVLARSAGCFRSSRLAREYGFAEDDGSLPPEIITLADHLGDTDMPSYWTGVERFPADRERAAAGDA
ncbi:MAG: SDR family NAD(P)-dependent oxidoreductase [Acidimicrobiales bacterium]